MHKKRKSSCPDGYRPAGIVIPLRLTKRQEKYSARAVGIARAVYNLMVATHQLARNHGHGPWPSPMEMEKLFNELKKGNPKKKGESEPTYQGPLGMTFVTKVSKFVAQGACRDFRSAYNRWRDPEIKAAKPAFHKKNAAGTGSFLAASGVDRIKYDGHRRITLPYLDFTQNPGEVMADITFVRSHWWLVSEGFSLSTANSDVQKLPATLYHRIADSLAYAA